METPASSRNRPQIDASRPISLPRALRLVQRIDFPHKLGIVERVYGRRLAPHGVCWVRTAADVVWKLDLRNPTHRWIVYGKYEGQPFIDWAKKFLPEDAIVVDSGANIGQMLLYYAPWIPRGRVLAFEPGEAAADWLQECLDVHPTMPVELIRLGLGAESTEAYLASEGGESIQGAWNKVTTEKSRGATSVRIVRLADALRERNIERIDLWKLDVEGYEIQALKGASELLAQRKIRALSVELTGDNGARTREFLEKSGYVCHLFAKSGALEKAGRLPEDTNGLFLPAP